VDLEGEVGGSSKVIRRGSMMIIEPIVRVKAIVERS
jgi:hypothetical protein